MNQNYNRPQAVSIFDKNEDIYELSNPFPVEITNFPADYALPAVQFDALAKEVTLADLNSKLNTLGQKTKPDSVPVVLASDQDNLSVNLGDETGAAYSSQNPLPTSSVSDLVSEEYNSIELTYVASGNGEGEIETVTYKNGSTTVAVLTLSYDSSDRINSIVRS